MVDFDFEESNNNTQMRFSFFFFLIEIESHSNDPLIRRKNRLNFPHVTHHDKNNSSRVIFENSDTTKRTVWTIFISVRFSWIFILVWLITIVNVCISIWRMKFHDHWSTIPHWVEHSNWCNHSSIKTKSMKMILPFSSTLSNRFNVSMPLNFFEVGGFFYPIFARSILVQFRTSTSNATRGLQSIHTEFNIDAANNNARRLLQW